MTHPHLDLRIVSLLHKYAENITKLTTNARKYTFYISNIDCLFSTNFHGFSIEKRSRQLRAREGHREVNEYRL